MSHYSFSELSPDYQAKIAQMVIIRSGLSELCSRLIKIKQRYLDVSAKTGVPAAWLMAVDYRESDNNVRTLFANGDPLDRISTSVPAGLGPFIGENAWQRGCIVSLEYDHINEVPQPWDAVRACYEGEAWNGFGVRAHGRNTGYVWAGTNVYAGGGYPSDGRWSSSYHDTRFGIAAIMLELGNQDASLALPGWAPKDARKPTDKPSQPPEDTQDLSDVSDLQSILNDLGYGHLAVDGSYGRKTRMAVKAFQKANALDQDGVVGPLTKLALLGAKGGKHSKPEPVPVPPKPETPETPTPASKPVSQYGLVDLVKAILKPFGL